MRKGISICGIDPGDILETNISFKNIKKRAGQGEDAESRYSDVIGRKIKRGKFRSGVSKIRHGVVQRWTKTPSTEINNLQDFAWREGEYCICWSAEKNGVERKGFMSITRIQLAH